MADCGYCEKPGATLDVVDAAGTKHVVHRKCWLEIQGVAGAVYRNLTPRGKRTAKRPRRQA